MRSSHRPMALLTHARVLIAPWLPQCCTVSPIHAPPSPARDATQLLRILQGCEVDVTWAEILHCSKLRASAQTTPKRRCRSGDKLAKIGRTTSHRHICEIEAEARLCHANACELPAQTR